MPVPNLFVKQYRNDNRETFMVFRYVDNGNNNYEYQVYKLVNAIEIARQLGAEEMPAGRTVPRSTREMWNWVWENIDPIP